MNYGLAGLLGISLMYTIVWLGITALLLVSMWKIFVKAGEPGWASLIPFYNTFVLFKIAYGDGWKMLFLLIPFANIVFLILCSLKLAEAFNQPKSFAIGMIFLPVVFYPLLAFGDATYGDAWY